MAQHRAAAEGLHRDAAEDGGLGGGPVGVRGGGARARVGDAERVVVRVGGEERRVGVGDVVVELEEKRSHAARDVDRGVHLLDLAELRVAAKVAIETDREEERARRRGDGGELYLQRRRLAAAAAVLGAGLAVDPKVAVVHRVVLAVEV